MIIIILLLATLNNQKIVAHRAIPNKTVETANTPVRIPTLTTEKFSSTNNVITANNTNSTGDALRSDEPMLIDSYLAPSMQALAYYIELLQYEPASMTTLEPPFSGWEAEGGTTYKPPPTPPRPSTTSTTKTSTVWWKPPSTQSTIWWVPPSTTKWTTTPRPTTTITTTRYPTTTKKPSYTSTSSYYDETKPTTQWWQTTTTTRKPISTIGSTTTQIWWQPPSWWTTSKPSTITRKTTTTYKPFTTTNLPETTPFHRPGVFAPTLPPLSPPPVPVPAIQFSYNYRPQYTSLNNRPHRNIITTEKISKATERFPKAVLVQEGRNAAIDDDDKKATPALSKPSGSISSSHSHPFDKDFFTWFTQKQAKLYKQDYEYDFQLLDPLPGALIRDIIQEKSELPAITDVDNINEFLKIYDDNFGRLNSITGKKRIPITKPYVEFLMLYDMLKRDAKAMNLSRYEGYSEEMLHELAELSQRSAERQLHTLLTRMLLRNDIDRTDTITRVKGIIKDLETPTGITAKAMRYFPPLKFVP